MMLMMMMLMLKVIEKEFSKNNTAMLSNLLGTNLLVAYIKARVALCLYIF